MFLEDTKFDLLRLDWFFINNKQAKNKYTSRATCKFF